MMGLKEKQIREEVDKLFGNRESAKEMKNAVLLARLGKLTDDTIAEYCKQKEEDLALLREQLPELNPTYAFDYIKECEFKSVDISDKQDDVVSESGFGRDKQSSPR